MPNKKSAPKPKSWNAECVARWYGFSNYPTPSVTPEDRKLAAAIRKQESFSAPGVIGVEELSRLLHEHRDSEWHGKPYAQFLTYRNSPSAGAFGRGRDTLALHAIGCPVAIADASLIKAAYGALEEEGHTKLLVRVSSVGQDQKGAFARELSAYLRKKLNEMSAAGRDLVKRHPFAFVAAAPERDAAIVAGIPDPLSFLNEVDRRHFAEVIEYLEAQGIPYEIDRRVVPDPHGSCRTAFRIESDGEVLAAGARYDGLAKKLGFKADIPAAYALIALKKPKIAAAACDFLPSDARYYLLQIGAEAKRRSHAVLDVLRKAKIPCAHSLDCDKLSIQLSVARKFGHPYAIVMGAREALDGTVIVRDADSRNQSLVKVADLPKVLRDMETRDLAVAKAAAKGAGKPSKS
jgi:histidyl-tRNA synthetase